MGDIGRRLVGRRSHAFKLLKLSNSVVASIDREARSTLQWR
jgi:hypothetical protein